MNVWFLQDSADDQNSRPVRLDQTTSAALSSSGSLDYMQHETKEFEQVKANEILGLNAS